jgi:DhnA family fructose-bisphosphate aldolase class Ia
MWHRVRRDVITVTYPGDCKTFDEIVDSWSVPAVAAGGCHINTFEQALIRADDIITCGASDLTVGRNFRARDQNTITAVNAYKLLVHDRVALRKASEMVTGISRD